MFFCLVFLNAYSWKYWTFGLAHLIFVSMIILLFETSSSDLQFKSGRKNLQVLALKIFFGALRIFSSLFFLSSSPNPDKEKHTFLSQSLYSLLLLIENLMVVVPTMLNPDSYPSFVSDVSSTLVVIVCVGWAFSVICQVLYYTRCHHWKGINGPTKEGNALLIKSRMIWKENVITFNAFRCCTEGYSRMVKGSETEELHRQKEDNQGNVAETLEMQSFVVQDTGETEEDI
eukprot:TRINITY_DN6228_c0_g1_i4.p1 TRINITY_DN6228_c0_g1~~TRINITY_DN6228_c0_g1_i4.p1  ORF type:complete len:249 (-),score=-6.56 TRINITY_DN6228_c0_g1_i4:141-830(-)